MRADLSQPMVEGNCFRRLRRIGTVPSPINVMQVCPQQNTAADAVLSIQMDGGEEVLQKLSRSLQCQNLLLAEEHVRELESISKSYSRVPDAKELKKGDVAIVIEPKRKYFGRLCRVNHLTAREASISPIIEILVSQESFDIEVKVPSSTKDGDDVSISVGRTDISRLAWPALREPPQPLDELHFVSLNWNLISNKRYSESRLRPTLEMLDGCTRDAFTKIALHTQNLHKRIAFQRCKSWAALRELLDVVPQRAPTSYWLFTQEASLQISGLSSFARAVELGQSWKQLSKASKESYEVRAKELAATERSQLQKFATVAIGQGWSECNARFFPQGAKRCLRMVLLCQARTGSTASKLSAFAWKADVFPFIPAHWFVKLDS